MKKDKQCPLCNGKPFRQGDDFKTLCIDHSCEAIGIILAMFAVEIIDGGRRPK